MVGALQLTVASNYGEMPLSLASRLAYRNYAPGVAAFCEDMGIDHARLYAGDEEQVRMLAKLAGAPVERLLASNIQRDGSGYILAGEKLTRNSVSRMNGSSFCPCCLVEDMDDGPSARILNPYRRVWWAVEGIRTCHKHSRPILSWRRSGKGIETDFCLQVSEQESEIRSLAARGSTRKAHEGEVYLHKRLMKEHQLPIWLDNLEFAAASKAMDMFGAAALFGINWKVREITSDQWAQAAATGYEIVKDGPLSIRPFLEKRFDNRDLSAMAGFHEIVGRQLYSWLGYKLGSTDLEPLRAIVRDFIIDTAPIDTRVPLLGQMIERSRMHSVYTAAANSKLHQSTVKKVLIGAGIISADDDRPENRTIFPVEPATRLLQAFSEGIPQKSVEKYLNSTLNFRKAIVEAALIAPVVRCPGLKPVYHPDVLDSFLVRLSVGAAQVERAEAGQVGIMEAARRAKCLAMDVVQLLLDGRLNWVGMLKYETGISAILVRLSEVTEATEVELPGIKILSWAKEFGIPRHLGGRCLTALRAKTVRVDINRRGEKYPVLPFHERARIAREFVSLRDVAASRSESPRRALRSLSNAGVQPLNLGLPGLHVYRRSTIV